MNHKSPNTSREGRKVILYHEPHEHGNLSFFIARGTQGNGEHGGGKKGPLISTDFVRR